MPKDDENSTWDDIYRLLNPLANVVDIQSEYKETQDVKGEKAAKEEKARAEGAAKVAEAEARAAERVAKAEAEAAKAQAEAEVIAAKAEAQNASSYAQRAEAEAKVAEAETRLAAANAEAARYAVGKWATVATAGLLALGIGAWVYARRKK